LLRIDGSNIRETNANDVVNLFVHAETATPVQFSFTVPVEKSLDGATGQTITVTTHYRFLRNGEAFYPDHVEIEVPSRKFKIKVENLNMSKKL
jgi:hypothetical protein